METIGFVFSTFGGFADTIDVLFAAIVPAPVICIVIGIPAILWAVVTDFGACYLRDGFIHLIGKGMKKFVPHNR